MRNISAKETTNETNFVSKNLSLLKKKKQNESSSSILYLISDVCLSYRFFFVVLVIYVAHILYGPWIYGNVNGKNYLSKEILLL